MARYSVDYTYVNALFNRSEDTDKWQAWLVDVRDRFRTALGAAGYVVSDIFRWQTANTTTFANAFIIQKGDQEWLLIWGRKIDGSSGYMLDMADWFNSSTTVVDSYFRSVDFDNSPNSATLAFHYNSRKGSYNVGFDDAVNLTFTGGDFSAPTTNPWTDHTSFMPQGALRGVGWNTYTWDDNPNATGRFFFIFDDTHGYVAVYATNEVQPYIEHINIFGSALTPFNDLDTNEEVAFTHRLVFSTTSGISTYADSMGLEFYDPDDNLIVRAGQDSDISLHYNFTYQNVPREDGTWPWSRVGVSSPDAFKGWFKTHVLRIIGAYNAPVDYYRAFQTPAGPLIKYHRQLAYPWVEDKPAPPYPDTGYKKGFDFR